MPVEPGAPQLILQLGADVVGDEVVGVVEGDVVGVEPGCVVLGVAGGVHGSQLPEPSTGFPLQYVIQ